MSRWYGLPIHIIFARRHGGGGRTKNRERWINGSCEGLKRSRDLWLLSVEATSLVKYIYLEEINVENKQYFK